MRTAKIAIAAILTAVLVLVAQVTAQPVAAPIQHRPITTTAAPTTTTTTTLPPIMFKHGDVTWLEPLALEAGWTLDQIPRLAHIILRESGGCPRRIGGSVVDKNCNFIKMSTMTHPSDSGLLQINGVHWKKDHAQYAGLICKQMKICTQEPLLDALTNLRAGRLLFDVAGWSPWNVARP